MNFAMLREPFPAADVEWRLQECGKKGEKIWAMCLAYLTNRAIMQRLDEVCGPENWKNEYRPGPLGGIICGLSIKCGEEWVCKWDGADNTQVEATKGGLSDAMKRAAVQWGIGRYLYNLEAGFATITDNGEYRGKVKEGNIFFKWNPPKLPAWALPAGHKAEPQQLGAESADNAPSVAPPPVTSPPVDSKPATEGQIKMLFANLKKHGVTEADFKVHFNIVHMKEFPFARVNEALKAFADGAIKATTRESAFCSFCGKTDGHEPLCLDNPANKR